MSNGRATWAAALVEAGCYDFLAPVADKTIEAACKQCPEGALLLGDAARADLRDICLRRLGIVYERPLVLLAMRRVRPITAVLLNARSKVDSQEMASIAQDVSHEVARDAGASLRARIPYALSYEHAMAANLGDALAEFLGRLSSRRDEVSRELLGAGPSRASRA